MRKRERASENERKNSIEGAKNLGARICIWKMNLVRIEEINRVLIMTFLLPSKKDWKNNLSVPSHT